MVCSWRVSRTRLCRLNRLRLNLRLHVHRVEVRQVNHRHANVQCHWRRLRDCHLGQICNRVNLRDDNLRMSMKSERFVAGQLWIERNRRREGPPVVYTVMSGKSARPFTDTKAILKWVKWPKGTPTGDALRDCLPRLNRNKRHPRQNLTWRSCRREGFGLNVMTQRIRLPTLKW